MPLASLFGDNPSLEVTAPSGVGSERFPAVVYMHGGYVDAGAYSKMVALIASWGFVVLAPRSCYNPPPSAPPHTQWAYSSMQCLDCPGPACVQAASSSCVA
jgi:poly(3-hydroxybutyrate) depolymerase|eukprot:2180444-Prymnesium_polylepis.1